MKFRVTDLIFSPVAGSGPRIRMLKDISGNIFKFDIGESDIIKLAENLILGIIALYAINLPLRFVRLPTN